jgi:ATP-dependent Clp protease adaptor protein ClpS
MSATKTIQDTDTDTDLQMPSLYKVILVNDDSTPVDFVIALLEHVFKHDTTSAQHITMQIHNEGSGVAGIYPFEIAEQKGVEATTIARQNGYPLVIQVEEE